MPLNATVCGLAGALSLNDRVAVRRFLLVGVYVTLTLQVAAGARPTPPIGQVFAKMANSPGFEPPIEMLLKMRFEPPVLVTVTVCGVLVVPRVTVPKFSEVGDKLMPAAPTPVPVIGTDCGLAGSEEVMTSVDLSGPSMDGLNRTLRLQLRPALRVLLQLLETKKSAAFGPTSVVLMIVMLVVPTLVSVRVREVLVVPITWFPNASVAGLMASAVPRPDNGTVKVGLKGSELLMVNAAVRLPAAVGLNVTLIRQFEGLPAGADKLVGHPLDSTKSPGFAPVRVMLLMASGAVPVLDSVTV